MSAAHPFVDDDEVLAKDGKKGTRHRKVWMSQKEYGSRLGIPY